MSSTQNDISSSRRRLTLKRDCRGKSKHDDCDHGTEQDKVNNDRSNLQGFEACDNQNSCIVSSNDDSTDIYVPGSAHDPIRNKTIKEQLSATNIYENMPSQPEPDVGQTFSNISNQTLQNVDQEFESSPKYQRDTEELISQDSVGCFSSDQHSEVELGSDATDLDRLNKTLRDLFTSDIKLNRLDSETTKDIILRNVNSLLTYVNKNDHRFGKEPIKLGSYWQGLKIERADEFDLGVPLVGLGQMDWVGGTGLSPCGPRWTLAPRHLMANIDDKQPRFYGFNMKVNQRLMNAENCESLHASASTLVSSIDSGEVDVSYSQITKLPPELNVVEKGVSLPKPPIGYAFVSIKGITNVNWRCSDLVRGGDLVPFLVKRRFRELLSEAIEVLEKSLEGYWQLSDEIHGPALPVIVRLNDEELKIDFVTTIQAQAPFPPWTNWPRTYSNWPANDTISSIYNLGVDVVSKKDFYWSISFAEAEKMLVKTLDRDGGCRKRIHKIMKMIGKEYWSQTPLTRNPEPIITSYMLKNIWFAEMECFPDYDAWSEAKMAERLLSMTRTLLDCLDTGELRTYFNWTENLLNRMLNCTSQSELEILKAKIQNFLNYPMCYLAEYDQLNGDNIEGLY